MNGLVVMISGRGSLLQAMIDAKLPISAVIADRECFGLSIAEEAGIKTFVIPRNDFSPTFGRLAYTSLIEDALVSLNPKIVAMAGFKTVLDMSLFKRFPLKIVNIHPSLLPAFPGGHAVRDTLAYGARISGCTIHFATAEVDHGPILLQEGVVVFPSDTEESLHERINQVEKKVYPRVLKELLELRG